MIELPKLPYKRDALEPHISQLLRKFVKADDIAEYFEIVQYLCLAVVRVIEFQIVVNLGADLCVILNLMIDTLDYMMAGGAECY